MVRRLADWLEKMSIAALAVGLFQTRNSRMMAAGIAFFAASMIMSWYLGRRVK